MRLPAVAVRVFCLVPFVLAVPAPAHAAVATLTSVNFGGDARNAPESAASLSVSGDGRADDILVDGIATDDPSVSVFVVTNPAGMEPGPGCESVRATAVSCRVASRFAFASRGVDLDLGDGDDREEVRGVFTRVDIRAGAGDDTLTGIADESFPRPFFADGGPGDDALAATSSGATLSGGPGDDRLDAGTASGAALSYATSIAGVRVDLAGGFGGAAGERDVIVGRVTGVVGSGGDDDLRGTDADEGLNGGGGNDALYGRGGADTLEGGRGDDLMVGGTGDDLVYEDGKSRPEERDRAEGGPGDDVLFASRGRDTLVGGPGQDSLGLLGAGDTADARDGEADLVYCRRPPRGTPRPYRRVLRVDAEDAVVEDCTGTRRTGLAAGVLTRVDEATDGGQLLKVRLACPVDAAGVCPFTLALTAGKLGTVGRRSVRLPRAATRAVGLPLTARARDILRCTGRLAVRLTFITRDVAGRRRQRTRNLTARAGIRAGPTCMSG